MQTFILWHDYLPFPKSSGLHRRWTVKSVVLPFNCIIRDARPILKWNLQWLSFILKPLTLSFIRNHTNWSLKGRRYSFFFFFNLGKSLETNLVREGIKDEKKSEKITVLLIYCCINYPITQHLTANTYFVTISKGSKSQGGLAEIVAQSLVRLQFRSWQSYRINFQKASFTQRAVGWRPQFPTPRASAA